MNLIDSQKHVYNNSNKTNKVKKADVFLFMLIAVRSNKENKTFSFIGAQTNFD